jgi:hypothetical protein
MDSDRGEDMVTEQWIVVCMIRREGINAPSAAHGPFLDEHRAAVWADQHEQDIKDGHNEKCPLGNLLAWADAIRLERLA